MKQTKEEKKIKALELYKNGRSIISISKELSMCNKTISKILKTSLITVKIGNKIKNIFDETYFEQIDTEDKAYFLGLLYADGNVYLKRKRMQLTLQNEDFHILETFADVIKYKGKIYNDRQKYSKLILSSDNLTSNLINLGCIPNKSLILKFPTTEQVPNRFIHHFIRGYFDGDGSIVKREKYYNISFTSNEGFLKTLSEFLHEKLNIQLPKYYKRYENKEISAGSIFLSKQDDIKKLFDFMYKDKGNFYFKRKYKKFNYENC